MVLCILIAAGLTAACSSGDELPAGNTGGAAGNAGGSVSTSGGASVGGGAGVGGNFAVGGTDATGGGAPAGGEQGVGGETMNGIGGNIGSGGASLMQISCAIDIVDSAVTEIATVGEVSFTTDLPGVSSAEIQFGKEFTYGLVAPVDMDAANYRTLLLGMAQSSIYNYRIAVSNGTGVCYSDNQTITTGTLSQAALGAVTTSNDAADGFIVASRGNDVIIFNNEGELVWGYTFSTGVFRGHISWDGQYMLARDLGPFDSGTGGMIFRVKMDGSGSTSFDVPGGDHHDFTPIPGGFAYMAKQQAGQCDRIITVDIDGNNEVELVDMTEAWGHFPEPGSELCHCNVIHYSSDGDFYTVSDREKDALVFFNGDGSVFSTVGTTPQDSWSQHVQAEGAGTIWRVQHGHHWYADDKFVVFSNGSLGGGTSRLLHYTITAGGLASLDWQYDGAGNSATQGSAQYLPNGNFLVTSSNAGNMHEVDADQNLIASYKTSDGGGVGPGAGGFGYAAFRPTLYGPPPGR